MSRLRWKKMGGAFGKKLAYMERLNGGHEVKTRGSLCGNSRSLSQRLNSIAPDRLRS